MLMEEGMENVFARHARHGEATRRAVRAWGLEIQCLDEREYSGVLTAVRMPDGHNADAFRKVVLEHFNMSLGNGLSKLQGKVFRIGHLGDFNELSLCGTLAGVEMGSSRRVPHNRAAPRPPSTTSPGPDVDGGGCGNGPYRPRQLTAIRGGRTLTTVRMRSRRARTEGIDWPSERPISAAPTGVRTDTSPRRCFPRPDKPNGVLRLGGMALGRISPETPLRRWWYRSDARRSRRDRVPALETRRLLASWRERPRPGSRGDGDRSSS